MTYYISDLHLDMTCKPFKTAKEKEEELIKRWNARVCETDNVFILGDLGKNIEDIERFFSKVKGVKHLIIGNHDKKSLFKKRLKRIFLTIQDIKIIRDRGQDILLCHYYIKGWKDIRYNSLLLYGHRHSDFDYSQKGSFNVSCMNEVMNFTPRTLPEITSKKETSLRKKNTNNTKNTKNIKNTNRTNNTRKAKNTKNANNTNNK